VLSTLSESAHDNWRCSLAPGLNALGLAVPAETRERLLAFVELLLKWNKAYSLTAIDTPREALVRHVFDSLSISAFLRGGTVLDVGTGAGLPGLPLALTRPELHFTLLDSNGKKFRFVNHAVMTLELKNTVVVGMRAEDYRPGARFDTVVSRAFSKLAAFVRIAGDLCAPAGRILAMKGVYPREELQRLPEGFRVAAIHQVTVPGLAAERHVVEIVREPRL
jgi:16S rRNA (guanine527-N7)-methyltransferase